MIMLGSDLRKWREQNGYTQERLRLALGVTRQTIVAWEHSQGTLAQIVQLALLALEHLPERCSLATGVRCDTTEYRFMRKRPVDVGSHAARPDHTARQATEFARRLNSRTQPDT